MAKFLAAIGLVAGGTVLGLGLIAVIFALSTLLTGAIVLLIWNVFALHTVFGLSTLGFWGAMAIGAGINLLRSIISPSGR